MLHKDQNKIRDEEGPLALVTRRSLVTLVTPFEGYRGGEPGGKEIETASADFLLTRIYEGKKWGRI